MSPFVTDLYYIKFSQSTYSPYFVCISMTPPLVSSADVRYGSPLIRCPTFCRNVRGSQKEVREIESRGGCSEWHARERLKGREANNKDGDSLIVENLSRKRVAFCITFDRICFHFRVCQRWIWSVKISFIYVVPNTKHLIKIIWDIIRDLIRDTFWRRVKSGQFLCKRRDMEMQFLQNMGKLWDRQPSLKSYCPLHFIL